MTEIGKGPVPTTAGKVKIELYATIPIPMMILPIPRPIDAAASKFAHLLRTTTRPSIANTTISPTNPTRS